MNLDYPTTRLTVSRDLAPQEVALRVQFAQAIDDRIGEYWVSILEQVSIVTNAGGFAGASVAPWESAMVPKRAQRVGDAGLAVTFTVQRVDFGYFRVLHNCLASAHVYNARLASLDIQTSAAKDLVVMGAAEVSKVPYPGAASGLPFALDREPLAPVNGSVSITLETPGSTAEKVGPLMAALTAWGHLLLGGYPEDGEHPFSCVSDCTTPEWTGDGISFVLPTYMGSEAAFDAVISMARRSAHDGLVITRLTIESM
jgi:hypothetical protein